MTNKVILWLVLVGLVAIPLSVACALTMFPQGRDGQQHAGTPKAADGEDEDDAASEAQVPTVKTIRPRRDPSFVISVDEPAYVEAYFKADLMARAAGPVKSVRKDVGD